MMSIAAAAGISKASVFHYASKEAYIAALNTILEEMGAFIQEATGASRGVTDLDRLTDAVVDYFAFSLKQPNSTL